MTGIQRVSVSIGVTVVALALGFGISTNWFGERLTSSADVTFNALGVSGGGSSGGSSQIPPTAPGVPGANVTGESAASTLTWTWGIATDCSGCAGILAYYLDIGSSAGGSDVVNDAVISGGATSYSHDTLAGQKQTYYATVYAKSAGGTNSATSQSITNPTIDRAVPVLSGVTTGSITQSSAVITWTTNEAATSQLTSETAPDTAVDGSLTTSHSVSLTALSAGTTYTYNPVSTDALGNTGYANAVSFTTTAAAASSSTSSTSSASPASSSETASSSSPSTSSSSSSNNTGTTSSSTMTSTAAPTPSTTTPAASTTTSESTTASSTKTSSTGSASSASQATSSSDQATVASTTPSTPEPVVVDLATPPADPVVLKKDQPLTVKGTAPAKAIVIVYLYSDPQMYTTTAGDDGSWSVNVPAADLAPGDHRVELAIDAQPRQSVLEFKVADASGTVPVALADDATVAQATIDEADRTQSLLLIVLGLVGIVVVGWFATHRAHAHFTQPEV